MKVESSITLDSSTRWRPSLQHMGFLGWGGGEHFILKSKYPPELCMRRVFAPLLTPLLPMLPQPMGGIGRGDLYATLESN